MAKLPGINYGAPVPSLGREDPMGPIRLAKIQTNAASAIGKAVGNIGDTYIGIKEEEGRNALVDAASAWRQGEAEIRTNPNIDERSADGEELRRNIEEEFTGGMHSISSKAFKAKWDEWSQKKLDGIVTDGIKEQYLTQRATTETNALKMARSGELTEALGYLGESTVLTATEISAIGEAARLEFALGDLERTTNSGDPDMVAELLGELQDPDYTGPFEDSNRAAAIRQLETAFDTATAGREARINHDRERFASNLERRVRKGLAGPVDIRAAFEEIDENGDHTITGPKMTQLLGIYDDMQMNLQNDYNKISMVKGFLATGVPMDRENTDHVDAVDFAYDDFVRRNGNNTQLVAEYGVQLAGTTNILPESLEADLRRLAFAGAPKAVESMANIYEALEREAPQVLDGIGTKEKAIYKSTMSYFRGGTDLDRATELARENAYKNPEEKVNLSQRYSIEFSPNISDSMKSFQGWLDNQNDQFDVSFTGMGGAPLATNANYTAYRSMEKEYWINTNGDAALTQQFAREDYKRLFSTSKMNGNGQIMPYAPEREYGLDVGNESMLSDLHGFYKKEGISGSQPFILPDARTARDGLGKRTYAVYAHDEFGNPRIHDKRWKMNMTNKIANDKAEDQAEHDRQKKIDKYMAERPIHMGIE
jgi:hypothetical protein